MDNLEREVKVQRYYPNVIANADEFKQLAILENEEFKSIWEVLFKWFKNKFVYEADLQGIQRWEEMLKIIPKSKETLEDRRSNILVKINSILPYTIRRLKQILDLKFGKDNAIPITTKNYELIINFNNEIELNAKTMRALLRAIIPANLIFKIIISWNFEQNIYNKASIIQYINTNHNFWNLGTAEKTYWDGVWCWDGSIDWSGIKPDAKYKERQSHVIDILTKVNSAQTFKTGQSADITYKITSKHRLLTSHKAGSIYYVDIDLKQNIEHRALNTGKINAMQSRTTGNAKNLWDGSFCWDGSHAWEGDYTLQNAQMENLCTVYSTDRNGNMKKGTFEKL